MNKPLDAAEAIEKIRHLSSFHSRGVLRDAEVANMFLCTVMEAPLDATEECLAALAVAVHARTREMLTEFAQRDYYDDRHAYINDGMTLAERQQYYRQRQPHYRAVGERLLELLRSNDAT